MADRRLISQEQLDQIRVALLELAQSPPVRSFTLKEAMVSLEDELRAANGHGLGEIAAVFAGAGLSGSEATFRRYMPRGRPPAPASEAVISKKRQPRSKPAGTPQVPPTAAVAQQREMPIVAFPNQTYPTALPGEGDGEPPF
ncbi:hypothetical protein D3874_21780 [Oleomonas cavernae]|uniref:Uncharacterized protein n=1 Tax=Oleomonas cavernae TaxID=2320859 RepID=A0A418WGX6_9PROT|nr:hypothetical protein [Oleomonas cavernae]RJF89275.1 hypothetical protein D3874_21780 [Oleomonas cavernae]